MKNENVITRYVVSFDNTVMGFSGHIEKSNPNYHRYIVIYGFADIKSAHETARQNEITDYKILEYRFR